MGCVSGGDGRQEAHMWWGSIRVWDMPWGGCGGWAHSWRHHEHACCKLGAFSLIAAIRTLPPPSNHPPPMSVPLPSSRGHRLGPSRRMRMRPAARGARAARGAQGPRASGSSSPMRTWAAQTRPCVRPPQRVRAWRALTRGWWTPCTATTARWGRAHVLLFVCVWGVCNSDRCAPVCKGD